MLHRNISIYTLYYRFLLKTTVFWTYPTCNICIAKLHFLVDLCAIYAILYVQLEHRRAMMKEMLIDEIVNELPSTTLNRSMKKQLFDDLTRNLASWKDPVQAVIPVIDFAEYNEACVYFTGSKLKIVSIQGQRVGVESAGYCRDTEN